jgi:hypothetical protein
MYLHVAATTHHENGDMSLKFWQYFWDDCWMRQSLFRRFLFLFLRPLPMYTTSWVTPTHFLFKCLRLVFIYLSFFLKGISFLIYAHFSRNTTRALDKDLVQNQISVHRLEVGPKGSCPVNSESKLKSSETDQNGPDLKGLVLGNAT